MEKEIRDRFSKIDKRLIALGKSINEAYKRGYAEGIKDFGNIMEKDWIFVKDHCEAITVISQKGERGEIYNIAGGEERTNVEVVNEILRIMGKPDSIEFVEDRPGHDLRYSLDSSKIKSLEWTPRYSFKDGLEETVKWYVENNWWWQPLADEGVLHHTPWKLEWG